MTVGISLYTERDRDLPELVARALDGDQNAWNRIVDRFAGLVWSVTRSFGLSPADAAEVNQTTWLLLAEHLGRIERPERLNAWLVTTARRETMRYCKRHARVIPSEDRVLEHELGAACAADHSVLADERDAAVAEALTRLPERSRTLLVLLFAEPRLSYQEISDELEISIGSIGPTRARAVAALRKYVEEAGILHDD